ncbi:MAG TPA: hypothetical protein DEV93_15315 [Chloroflexi bacterium]|jgi:hypothetical protein|nr:hypothetical protein [Chloroflexota bacterium]
MDTPQAISLLSTFNTKVNKLQNLSFFKDFPTTGVDFSWTKGETPDKDVTIVTRHGISEESIDAFVLTLRLLVQPRDQLSIVQIADLYVQLPVSVAAKEAAQVIKKQYEDFMGRSANIRVAGTDLTNKQLFDTFTYGDLAHVNKDKVELYEKIAGFDVGRAFLLDDYIEILAAIHRIATRLRSLNEQTIASLQISPTKPTI